MNKSTWHERNKQKVKDYMREYHRKRRAAEDPEKRRAIYRAWYQKTKDIRIAKSRAYYATRKRGRTLELKYGITAEQYDTMLAAQNNRCAICVTDAPGGRFENFHVDHCHATSKVRGLLCNSCNHLLGNAKDSVETLRAAARYLTRCGRAA